MQIGDSALVEYFLKEAAARRNRDVRIDILLEIGYLLKGEAEKTWCNVITIGKVGDQTSTGYFAEAIVDGDEMPVFTAEVNNTTGQIEWLDFVPEQWQKHLANWYNEVRARDLAAIPRLSDATGAP